jgi:hypothetical protein
MIRKVTLAGNVVVDERQQRGQNRLLRDRAARARDAAGRWTKGWKKVYLLSGHRQRAS